MTQRRYEGFKDAGKGTLICSGTVAGTAVAITALTGYVAATVADSVRATITAREGGVMFTYDGTTPTADIGHYVGPNQSAVVVGTDNINALKLIREASTSAKVTITVEL